MRYVPLPNGIPSASVLGLGCAAMMGSASRSQSLAALIAAFDSGITFFDTARSYGYGASESLLGEFFHSSSRRSQAILCTKFGILPAPRTWMPSLKPIARTAIKLFPSLRRVARAQTGRLFSANHFSVDVLRTSLDTSLRELRTDYVDILLMHAAPLTVLAQQDLLDELQRLVGTGKVRLAGISGEHDVITATLAERSPVLQTAQFAADIASFPFLNTLATLTGSASTPLPKLFLVANHPFGGASGILDARHRIRALHADSDMDPALRSKLDPADPQLLPELVLNAILTGTSVDAIIPAMLNPVHLAANIRAITQCRFTPTELANLRVTLSSISPAGRPAATPAPSS